MIGQRLKDERERLGINQSEFAAVAGASKRTQIDWEKGVSSPTAVQLSSLAAIGVDVSYVVTGARRGHGIGESAVHQAVLDAIELLSLDKKVDANQLAKAVVKLCARQVVIGAEPASGTSGVTQTFQGPISGGVAGRNIVNKR